MKELLKEYRDTRRETTKILNEIQGKYDKLRYTENSRDLINVLSTEELALLHQYEEDMTIVRSWLSNINYTIEWIRKGKQPGLRRGIERQSAYVKEVPFEPYWIQLQKDTGDFSHYESFNSEDEAMVSINQEQKERTVASLTESLTERQKEVLDLASNGFSHDEIAKILNVHKGTVSQTLNRVKEKIREEGWFMP
ncbi:sigma-70 family RNA polymerase sigma factor [Ureibacillus chungkukjangi]|uniref:sigma-70 family RNA polymerase sigma factor n=1 Tax=Ureibacillus chungkukjangi TaxID=1202712 RepID=UPI00384A61E2